MSFLMKKMLSRVVLCSFFFTFSAVAQAGVDKGQAAYRSGNFKAALKEFTRLANKGDAEAEYNLGKMYQEGKGVAKDETKAASWYQKAASLGNAQAEYHLGLMISQGLGGISRDDKEAVNLFNKAAEQGVAEAQFTLGQTYQQSTPPDYLKAAYWYWKASDQGYAPAQNELGQMYRQGIGVTQDNKVALFQLRKAAEQGVAAAQLGFGEFLANGVGINQDRVQAWKWIKLAANSGDQNALASLKTLEDSLSPAQLLEAEALVPQPAAK